MVLERKPTLLGAQLEPAVLTYCRRLLKFCTIKRQKMAVAEKGSV